MINIISEDIKSLTKTINAGYFKGKKILIFGGTGIIGQYFLIFFLSLKLKKSISKITIIIKNDLPNYLKFLNKNNKVKIIKCNITKYNFSKIDKYDVIIFSGGYGQPSKFLKNSLETIEINTNVLMKFFSKLKKNGKFLYISSSEIYNGNNKKKITENDIGFTNTNDPRSSYIEAKRCGETIVNIFAKKYNIDAKSIRLSLAYGPGVKKDDGRVLNEFITRSIKNKILYVMDSGNAIRRYIYIADAIYMMINILIFGKKNIYNVAGKEKTSISSIAKKIGKILQIKVKFKKKSSLKGSPKNTSLSINRYESEFGKTKLTSLDKGLNKTIDWYQNL